MIWIGAFFGALMARLVMPNLGLVVLLAPLVPGFVVTNATRSPEVIMAIARLSAAAGTAQAAPVILGLIAGLASFVIGLLLAALRAPR